MITSVSFHSFHVNSKAISKPQRNNSEQKGFRGKKCFFIKNVREGPRHIFSYIFHIIPNENKKMSLILFSLKTLVLSLSISISTGSSADNNLLPLFFPFFSVFLSFSSLIFCLNSLSFIPIMGEKRGSPAA